MELRRKYQLKIWMSKEIYEIPEKDANVFVEEISIDILEWINKEICEVRGPI